MEKKTIRMSNKTFESELKEMKKGLISLQKKKKNSQTYRAHDRISHLIEIQEARIDSLKLGYKLAYSMIKPQKKLT